MLAKCDFDCSLFFFKCKQKIRLEFIFYWGRAGAEGAAGPSPCVLCYFFVCFIYNLLTCKTKLHA